LRKVNKDITDIYQKQQWRFLMIQVFWDVTPCCLPTNMEYIPEDLNLINISVTTSWNVIVHSTKNKKSFFLKFHLLIGERGVLFNKAITYWDYIALVVDEWNISIEQWCNDTDTGKPKNLEKTCPSTTLSTTNPIRVALGSTLGLSGESPATAQPPTYILKIS
jgi:hypothetical protein